MKWRRVCHDYFESCSGFSALDVISLCCLTIISNSNFLFHWIYEINRYMIDKYNVNDIRNKFVGSMTGLFTFIQKW